MADVVIEINAHNVFSVVAGRGGVFWTSPTVGYVIYVNAGGQLTYQKTADGGATWGGQVVITAGGLTYYDCWADWQTAGDAGTKIHMAYVSFGSDDVRYVYLDTSDDSVGGDVQIEAAQGTGSIWISEGRGLHLISITKTRGGNLAVAFRYRDTGMAYFYGFYTSPDGNIWNSKASPWEGDNRDYILLFAGNEADNQDVWATFWDVIDHEISLKTYDNSGNSWSEQSISDFAYYTAVYLQMDGAIRLSDGHLIFAYYDQYDKPASNLKTWDINGAGSIIAKTNVINTEAETFLVSVFINQVNDDIYVAYVSGTEAEKTVAAFYQKSVDGGANWGGEQALQADAEDDMRWISAGAMKAVWGGKFQPYWFDDDDNDLFTNTDNGISIAAFAPPTGIQDKSANMGSKLVAAILV